MWELFVKLSFAWPAGEKVIQNFRKSSISITRYLSIIDILYIFGIALKWTVTYLPGFFLDQGGKNWKSVIIPSRDGSLIMSTCTEKEM